MTPPPPAKRSLLFWIALVGVGSCGLCSVAGLGLMVLGASSDSPPSASAPAARSGGGGALPTGETPDLFPGMPGWLPSGRGVEIPEAEIVDGQPRGLWWTQGSREIYLEDGTWASNPRPGGAQLFDLEGQKRQRGSTGVGTFSVDGDSITRAHDGFTSTDPFAYGEDDDGRWVSIRSGRHRAISLPDRDQLLGRWTNNQGSQYEFFADGTYQGGFNLEQVVGGHHGTWVLDGYLLQIAPSDGASWIQVIGAISGGKFLVIGNYLFSRP